MDRPSRSVPRAAQAAYYGDSSYGRTPPPDLPSLLLKER
ncbi:MAG: ATP-dependent Clp protease proteolytic subunit, partial [Pseudanabaena sp.]